MNSPSNIEVIIQNFVTMPNFLARSKVCCQKKKLRTAVLPSQFSLINFYTFIEMKPKEHFFRAKSTFNNQSGLKVTTNSF